MHGSVHSSAPVWALLLITASASVNSFAAAESYPVKPVRMVTAGAGGGNDFVARILAQGLSGSLGQQVIVDNRPSATSAGEITAKALPDGYTLMYYGSNIWVLPLLRSGVPFDPVKDFAPIILAVSSPNLVVAHPSLPVKSIKELIAYAKANPGELNCSSGTTGSSTHLAVELFKVMTGVNMVNVFYKSGGGQIPDLLAGRVQLAFLPAASVAPYVKSGKLRALAVTSNRPSALAPDLPTVAAAGLPGYESMATQGVFAPAHTPAAIIKLVNQEIGRLLNQAEIRENLLNSGVEAVGSTPEQFGVAIKSEMMRLGKVIREAGIREQ
jgi:tripartite-type tricarboxylate transporter receptor subunit TctC